MCNYLFDSFVTLMVLGSCVILMLDDVTVDPHSHKATVLRNLDASFTAVFGLEVRSAAGLGLQPQAQCWVKHRAVFSDWGWASTVCVTI